MTIRSCGTWDSPRESPNDAHVTTPVVNTFDQFQFWYRPGKSVYRAAPAHRDNPLQGYACYDQWVFQQMYNNSFYDFFADEIENQYKNGFAPRHAIGVHFHNKFQMSPKNQIMKGTTFENCYRKVQFAFVEHTTKRWFGQTYGNNLYRDVGDGEKTAGFVDLDGHFSNGEPAYVLAPHFNGTIITGST